MTKKAQIQKFKDAARSLPTDDSERRFNERLGKIAKAGALPKPKRAVRKSSK